MIVSSNPTWNKHVDTENRVQSVQSNARLKERRYAVRRLLLVVYLCSVTGSLQAQRPVQGVDPAVARQMHEAVSVAQRGDEQRSLVLVDQLLKEHPSFVPALKLQGMLLEDTGHGPEASVAYEKALTLSPNDAELLLKVGIAKLVSGDAAKAASLLQRRLRTVPRDEEGLYYLAQAYHLNGNDELALKAIREAATVSPASAPVAQKYGELLCSSGDTDEAMRWLLKAQQLDPTLERINFDLAVASYNRMDLEKAVSYSAHEVELRPNDLNDLILLASAEVKLARWQDAEAILRRVVAERNDDAAVQVELGHCELELKNYTAAVDALQRALQVDPTQVLAHFFLSRAYSGLGNVAEAQHEAALHKEMMQHIAFTLPKAEAQRESTLADQARQMLRENHEDEARRLFEATAKGPLVGPGSSWMSVGATYLSMGDAEHATRCLNRALEIDPMTRSAHLYLGILSLQQGDLSRAEREFEGELALEANNSLALGELGEVRYRQRRWADAVDLIVKSKTTTPSLLYMLCDSYFRLGETQRGDLTAESLAAYGRGEPQVVQALAGLLNRNGQTELAERLGERAQQP
jgi:Tfp pilus assembly protein PilF